MAQACVNSATVLTVTGSHPSIVAGVLLEAIVTATCKAITNSFDIWGDLADEAHKWLAAHFAVLIFEGQAGGAAGQLTSRTIDKLTESYSAGQFSDEELSSTEFGRMYMFLWRSLRTQRAISDGTDAPEWELPDRRIT